MVGAAPAIRRDPVNLGEVEGEICLPVSLVWAEVIINAKSSRRGKEEMELRISRARPWNMPGRVI